MNDRQSKKEQIWEYLNRKTSDGRYVELSSLQAAGAPLYTTKLTSRISDLRAEGRKIYSERVSIKDKDGIERGHYNRYSLNKPEVDDGGIHKDTPQVA